MKERLLKKIGFSHNRGALTEGIPKILDILEDARDIPHLHTDVGMADNKPIEVAISKPKTRADYLTVENFKQGLLQLQLGYQNIEPLEQIKRNVYLSFEFKNTTNCSSSFGSSFLTTYGGYGGLGYSLSLTHEGKKNGAGIYQARLKKETPKLEGIMDACSGPNPTEIRRY